MRDFIANHLPAVPVLWTLGAVYLIVTSGTAIAWTMRLRSEKGRELWLRCVSWWWMIPGLTIALILGQTATLILFCVVSYLALQEFLSIVPSRPEDRPIILLAYLIVPANALLIWFRIYGVFLIFVPVYAFVV